MKKKISISAEEELKLTIPSCLTNLTMDNFFMVALNKHNSDIVEERIKNDPAYNKSKAKKQYEKYSSKRKFETREYKAIIDKIASENSTRTPNENKWALAQYCAAPNNRFFERLKIGDPKLVDDLADHISCNGKRKEKSLCSKLCRYMNEWRFGKCDYTINDSVVRTIIPYYLAYYKVDRSLWQKKNLEKLTYREFYKIFSALRECVEDGGLNNHQLDHLIWYSYKNDPIRTEVAKALAKSKYF